MMNTREKAERILAEVSVEFAGYPDVESVTIKYEDAVSILEIVQAYLDQLNEYTTLLEDHARVLVDQLAIDNQWIPVSAQYWEDPNPDALYGSYRKIDGVWITSQDPTEVDATHVLIPPPPPESE